MMLLTLVAVALACDPTDPVTTAERAHQLVLEDRAADALRTLEAARPGLACAGVLLTPEGLSRFHQVGATAAAALGRPQAEVDTWLAGAVRLAMLVPADPKQPGNIRDRLKEMAANAATTLDAKVTTTCSVRVDGFEILPGEDRAVVPGEHYVQRMGAKGRADTRAVEVPAGGRAQLCPRSASARSPLAIAGMVALAGGAGMLVGTTYQLEAKGFDRQGLVDAERNTVNLLQGLGVGFTVAGAGLLGAAVVVPTDGGAFLTVGGAF